MQVCIPTQSRHVFESKERGNSDSLNWVVALTLTAYQRQRAPIMIMKDPDFKISTAFVEAGRDLSISARESLGSRIDPSPTCPRANKGTHQLWRHPSQLYLQASRKPDTRSY